MWLDPVSEGQGNLATPACLRLCHTDYSSCASRTEPGVPKGTTRPRCKDGASGRVESRRSCEHRPHTHANEEESWYKLKGGLRLKARRRGSRRARGSVRVRDRAVPPTRLPVRRRGAGPHPRDFHSGWDGTVLRPIRHCPFSRSCGLREHRSPARDEDPWAALGAVRSGVGPRVAVAVLAEPPCRIPIAQGHSQERKRQLPPLSQTGCRRERAPAFMTPSRLAVATSFPASRSQEGTHGRSRPSAWPGCRCAGGAGRQRCRSCSNPAARSRPAGTSAMPGDAALVAPASRCSAARPERQ